MTAKPKMRDPKLAIVAPSRALVRDINGSEIDTDQIERAVRSLRAQGWNVTVAENVYQNVNRFAGDDKTRAKTFLEAMLDPDVDLVMPIRGGYGAGRILSLVDWEALRGSHAKFVGLSDATVINLALLARSGLPSWQGPVARAFACANETRDAAFKKALGERTFSLRCAVSGPETANVRGQLWGGNLSMVVSLMGTAYFPSVEGGILFLEDVSEPAWRIERMLLQLLQSGVLAKQSALVFGDMTGSELASGQGKSHFGLSDVLAYILGKLSIPVISGIPFGHRSDTLTLPIGVEASLSVDDGFLELEAEDAPIPLMTPFDDGEANNWWI